MSLAGCGKTYQEATNKEVINKVYDSHTAKGYFTEIVSWGSDTYHVVYANDTKVKYFICVTGYKFGITPLYNADGTLQVYEGE